jgi:S-adenosylmethionine:tRNA ribosyltransferase-isomerase
VQQGGMMTKKEDYTKKSTYYYELPEELIAQHPLEKRDDSRMLVYDRKIRKIEHKHFFDIVDYFKEGDVLVLNNSRVLPARIFGVKETGAKIEVLLHKRIDLHTWEVVAKPTKRLSSGTIIKFSDELSGEVLSVGEYGVCQIKFFFKGSFEEILDRIGNMPLPPYIHEKLNDKERYQTVYSKIKGSSAAPTAGLHFTPQILKVLKDKGVIIVDVLLHVGLGTFRPVKEENILEHKMHSEYISVSPHVAKVVADAKREGRRVIACGTTSMRALESMCKKSTKFNGYELTAGQKETDIFIYPPYKFKIVDALITNFHLPESTLLMLISAFIGLKNVKKLYKIAIEEKYRFFSFGDCCLFL